MYVYNLLSRCLAVLGYLTRFGDCSAAAESPPSDLLFSFASTSAQNSVCMHTDVAALHPLRCLGC